VNLKGLTLYVGAALLLAGCGGGPRVVETREVAPFDRLRISDGLEVTVVPGSGAEVRVRAGRDVMDRVRTETSDGVLELDIVDRGIVIGPDPLGDVRIEVGAETVRGVRIDGSGEVALDGVDEPELELDVRGAGEVRAAGTVDRLDATIQGAGDAELFDLEARTATILIQGVADAELNVTEALDVTIQGAADVAYRGDPRITSEIEGPGDLREAS
jgi:hypothetical protein